MPNPYEYNMKNSNMQMGYTLSGNNNCFNNNFNKNYPTINYNIYSNCNLEMKPTNKYNNIEAFKLGYATAMLTGLYYLNNKLKEKISSDTPKISSNYNETPKENRIIIRLNYNKNSDDEAPYTVRTEGNYKFKGFERKNEQGTEKEGLSYTNN